MGRQFDLVKGGVAWERKSGQNTATSLHPYRLDWIVASRPWKYLRFSFARNFSYPSSRGPNRWIRASASRLLGPSIAKSYTIGAKRLTECPQQLYRDIGIGAALSPRYRGSSCPHISHPSKAGVRLGSQASASRLLRQEKLNGTNKNPNALRQVTIEKRSRNLHGIALERIVIAKLLVIAKLFVQALARYTFLKPAVKFLHLGTGCDLGEEQLASGLLFRDSRDLRFKPVGSAEFCR
jgi:hypothetical protein